MTNEIHQPTPVEIRAYEAKAHALRAEAMQDSIKAIASFVANLLHRVIDVFSRPAHA
jgi:hypothetical protein